MARETYDIYRDLNRQREIAGFVEENSKRKTAKICNKKIMPAEIIDMLPKSSVFIGAIGSPLRKRWIREIEQKGFFFDTIVHPSVLGGHFVKIMEGSIICPAVVLTCDIKVGRYSIVGANATINHDCVIGDFVTISPGVAVAGNVAINDECWIGIGATITNKVLIGRGSCIGAGAVVTQSIPENVLAVGVPAKPIRKLSESDWKELV